MLFTPHIFPPRRTHEAERDPCLDEEEEEDEARTRGKGRGDGMTGTGGCGGKRREG